MRAVYLAITFAVLGAAAADRSQIKVRILFTNGDRLTGDLRRADGQAVEFKPDVARMGSLMRLGWDDAGISALELGGGRMGENSYLEISLGAVSAGDGKVVCFKSAVATRSRDRHGILDLAVAAGDQGNDRAEGPADRAKDNVEIRTLEAATVEPAVAATPQATAHSTPSPAQPPANAGTSAPRTWAVNLSAPESIVQGTQSQQSLGGLFRTDQYAGDANHFFLVASGSHQHNLSLHKPSQRTDIFDSLVQYSRALPHDWGLYGVGEWYFHTALGMAAERSGGGGVIFPRYNSPSGNLLAKAWVDLRYINERLYAPKKLKLVGSVVHSELSYSASNDSWSLTLAMMLKPIFNDWAAKQASGSLTFNLPLGKHVCATLTPADETYIGNSPTGFRRNYLKSSVGLTVVHGSNSGAVCRQ